MRRRDARRNPVVRPPFDGHPGKCCWCGSALSGRQQRWCGKACVDAYLIAKGDQGRARSLLFKRDAGKCALCNTTPHERMCQGPPATPEWEADHTVPIIECGSLTLANLRTLCVPCHRSETKKLRARMAAARRDAKALLEKKT